MNYVIYNTKIKKEILKHEKMLKQETNQTFVVFFFFT